MDSTFTNGRRRAALMSCVEAIQRDEQEPTLGEVTRHLAKEGWTMDEVKEHLLVAADDPSKFHIKSRREIAQLGKGKYDYLSRDSHLPRIVEACRGKSKAHLACQLRSTIKDYSDKR